MSGEAGLAAHQRLSVLAVAADLLDTTAEVQRNLEALLTLAVKYGNAKEIVQILTETADTPARRTALVQVLTGLGEHLPAQPA